MTSRPAAIAAAAGSVGLIFRAVASGSSSRSTPSISTRRVMVDLPAPFGPAINVRVGTLCGASAHFADDLVVLASGRAGNPADFKTAAVGLFHDREALAAINIEHGTP